MKTASPSNQCACATHEPKRRGHIPALISLSLSKLPKVPSVATTPLVCDNSYITKKPKEAYWRVLFRNRPATKTEDQGTPKSSDSSIYLGEYGHLERANAWTHIIGALLFVIYTFVRIPLIDQRSLTAQLSGVCCMVMAIICTSSVAYHVYGTVRGCAATMRNIDITMIYIGFAFSAVADLALLTNDFEGVPFQAIIDPLLACAAAIAYFAIRRCILPPDKTRIDVFEDAKCIGLYRFTHSDLEHAGLRTACEITLTISWLLNVPVAFSNANMAVAIVWFTGVVISTVLIICGAIYDRSNITDVALIKKEINCLKCTECYSPALGCIMTSHTWWHVVSFVAMAIPVFARDYGVTKM